MYKFASPSKNVVGAELQRWKWMVVYPIPAIFYLLWHVVVKLEIFSDNSICLVYALFFSIKKEKITPRGP